MGSCDFRLKGRDWNAHIGGGFGLFLAFLAVEVLLALELVDKIRFRDELELARELQASLLPKTLPDLPAFELGAWNRIANTVGGDVYDFVPLQDGRLAVLFGDASGHGMAAGLVMAVAHAGFRTQLETDPSPEAMIPALNRLLCRTGGARSFFSCVYILASPDGGLRITVAGHPQVLRIDRQGVILERYGKGSYPLGIRSTLAWATDESSFSPGEALVLNSDGLTEARNAAEEEFGEERLEGVAAPLRRLVLGRDPGLRARRRGQPLLRPRSARRRRLDRGRETPLDRRAFGVLPPATSRPYSGRSTGPARGRKVFVRRHPFGPRRRA